MPAFSEVMFKRDFATILKGREAQLSQISRAGAMKILGKLVERSPVGNPSLWKHPESAPPGYVGGRFKANWQVGVGEVSGDVGQSPDASGANALSRGQAVLQSWNGIGKVYITNSLPYAKRIEYDSWSQQAPAGLVRIVLVEFRREIADVAKQIRAGATA